MSRSRSRLAAALARVLVTATLLLTIIGPASAVSPTVTITTAASPFQVTVNLPIAYVVTVNNGSNNALKNLRVSATTSVPLTYLGAAPTASCDQSIASCLFNGLASGASAQAIFYFQAPAAPGTFRFSALANFDGQTTESPANYQNTLNAVVDTVVLALDEDLVRGHSVAGFRTFTTGLGNLSTTNRHGTEVALTSDGEVTLEDLAANDPRGSCANLVGAVTSLPCFGEASYLSIANGTALPGGIRATMRWDYTDLPNGMTEKKIRIVHIFDPGILVGGQSYELVTNLCNSATAPTNKPCLVGAPIRLADKDILATFFLSFNGVSKGW
jgi:hypothetical protein